MERQEILRKRSELRLDERLKNYKGVVGIDVENKRLNRQKTDTLSIAVYVEKKLQTQQLSDDEAIPEMIEGIPTDVVEVNYLWGPAHISQPRAAYYESSEPKAMVTIQATDELVGGLSICNQYTPDYYGTLGIVLPSKGAPTALSCAHVMVHPPPATGQGVMEPVLGTYPVDCIGNVSLYHFNDENTDAALVPITERSSSLWTVMDIGKIDGWGTGCVGDDVEKVGVTSGHTYGVISSTTYTLITSDPDWGDITLTNQIKIDSEFSKPGDSGSAVIDSKTKKMVGMVEAGGEMNDGEFFSVVQPSAYLQAIIP